MIKYAVKQRQTFGYALFRYVEQGDFWQQVSYWYANFGNLYRYMIKPLGLVLGESCLIDDQKLYQKYVNK